MQLLDQIQIDICDTHNHVVKVHVDVADNSLSRKWLAALNQLLSNQYHLEKNYCWMGWTESARNVEFLCHCINLSIAAINHSDLDYPIHTQPFLPVNVTQSNMGANHDRMNQLHRWFEDLQGHTGCISNHYQAADPATRWHIRQLNLLCHELECQILSQRKAVQAPEWRRPSQLMCWLNAPRYALDSQDCELFGIDTINRSLGGVYVGVNKAVGKHHWEVFQDEGRDSRIGELVTTSLRSQTIAAGDFDIEWARDTGAYHWQVRRLSEFRSWLVNNGFDPDDKSLTIGHPKVAQVDLTRSFGTTNYQHIWATVGSHLDVCRIKTSTSEAIYNYRWTDVDYAEQQIRYLK